jgi:hypothetical protein
MSEGYRSFGPGEIGGDGASIEEYCPDGLTRAELMFMSFDSATGDGAEFESGTEKESEFEHSLEVDIKIVDSDLAKDKRLEEFLRHALYPMGQVKYGSDGVRMLDVGSLNDLLDQMGLSKEWGVPEEFSNFFIEPQYMEDVESEIDPYFDVHETNTGRVDEETGEVEVVPVQYTVNLMSPMEEYYKNASEVEEMKWRNGDGPRPCEVRSHTGRYTHRAAESRSDPGHPEDDPYDDESSEEEYPSDHGHL